MCSRTRATRSWVLIVSSLCFRLGQGQTLQRDGVEGDEDARAAHRDGRDFGAEYEADGFEEAGYLR